MRKNYLFYQFFRVIITKWGLIFYYRKIRSIGREKIPKRTPVMFIPNHQNSFMDALLVVSTNWKYTFFLTRAQAFNTAFMRWFLENLNMLPVYRVRDGMSSVTKNNAIFERCIRMLKKNYAVLVFAEANHNLNRRIRPLSKGFTRIAFDAEQKNNWDLNLQIIPVGVNYTRHKESRNDVTVVYGDPIPMKQYQELFEQDKRKAANVLKNDVAKVMKQCTMHVQNAQHYFLHQVLLDDLADDRSHLVDPKKVRPLNEKLDQLASEEDYLAAQELLEIAEKQHIDLSRLQEYTTGQQTPFWKRLLLSPFILLGFLNFRLAYIPVDKLIRNTIKDHAFDASIKFLVTAFLFPLSLSVISVALWVAGFPFNMLLIYWMASFFSLFGFKEWVNSHKQQAHNRKWSEFASKYPDLHAEMIEKLNRLSLIKQKLYN
jgi:1-acyl-sn-glycerol-3-phosphate acyltransferase